MSEAPERVWADGNAEWDSGSWGLDKEYDEDVEYTRTDLVRAQIEAAVKRALEGAASVAKNACLVPPDGGSPTEDEEAVCRAAADYIRALDPAQFVEGDKT